MEWNSGSSLKRQSQQVNLICFNGIFVRHPFTFPVLFYNRGSKHGPGNEGCLEDCLQMHRRWLTVFRNRNSYPVHFWCLLSPQVSLALFTPPHPQSCHNLEVRWKEPEMCLCLWIVGQKTCICCRAFVLKPPWKMFFERKMKVSKLFKSTNMLFSICLQHKQFKIFSPELFRF